MPSSIVLTSDLVLALKAADLIVLAIPSQFIRQVLKRVKELDVSFIPFLSVVKGIETETQMRVSEIIYQELGKNLRLAVLSGPTIALEVVKEVPTTAVISSSDEELAKSLQRVFMTRRFRVYTNPDVVGVELGGALRMLLPLPAGFLTD